MPQYFLVFLLLALTGLSDAQLSGKFCGSASTDFGDFEVEITITSQTTADVAAAFGYDGELKRGTAKGVTFVYNPSNGDIKVTDIQKLDDLIGEISAPISGSDLAYLKYLGDSIQIVSLGNFALPRC
ncbi:hypothetical protein Pmar_PMAR000527 [Perkinsus marinus ATCC 50983]|uniref:Uncharacterized protein n=1 Tax=Perkinsus marinus (strain ATCC 50983 / TXsc) TaxID=423536 RepID=C5LIV5_PERM5|nr:hypothetical protein Pmar_PMAR000527 [Perkinsus marinus ATCC 50983]EER03290.1 hypothetical protein Pmar_PMAR000527 [Perkinsus marinus ATCC 50983]|eukprot:XP_002771474.1 hypothetical protein Pmar_PMAR000527 [Perkinsus marinus ATCC 50983]